MKRAYAVIKSQGDRLLGVALGVISFLAFSAWLDATKPPPVEILHVEVRHPVKPGGILHADMTVIVRERCPSASAFMSLIAPNRERVWHHEIHTAGYTDPPDDPETPIVVPIKVTGTPLPADMPDGNYSLVAWREDRSCANAGTVQHPKRAFPVKIP